MFLRITFFSNNYAFLQKIPNLEQNIFGILLIFVKGLSKLQSVCPEEQFDEKLLFLKNL